MADPQDTMAQDALGGRRVIVHCGVQKTGSTALHRFLERNRAALADRIEVLTPTRRSLTQRLGRAAMQFSLDPVPERRAALAGFARDLGAHLAKGQGTALISHENLPGAMIGKRGVVTLYPHLEEILGILDEGLAPFVPEIVFYTREMTAWKSSVHNQAVKSDHYTGTRTEFLDETADCGTWDSVESRAVSALGRDRVFRFQLEDETNPRRPGAQLLRHAGLDDDAIAALLGSAGRANQSLNVGALEFLRQINGLSLDQPVRRKIVDLISANQSLFVKEARL